MSKHALFVVSDQGQGHRVRCGALADELRARGWECRDVENPFRGFTQQDRGAVLIVDAPFPDLKVTDIPRSVGIVDVPGGRYPVDLLVCGGAWATPEAFKDSGAKRVLAGPAYALLRPSFRLVRDEALDVWDRVTHKGGVFDARSIEGMSELELAVEMIRASVVISYASMRALEAACVGAPMVLVSRNEGERLNGEALDEAGAGVLALLEKDAEWCAESLRKNFDLAKMSAAGRALVDGLGCKRVADAIEEML